MMRVLFILGLVLGMSANMASAETVTVRSGAHEGFSRLVLDMPRQVPFRIENQGDTQHLIFAQEGLIFDTSAVFARIAKDRVTQFAPIAGVSGLSLSIGCDCEVDVFWATQTMLVLDVRDAAPELGTALGATPDDTLDIIAVMGADLTPITSIESKASVPADASFAVDLAERSAGQITAASLEVLLPNEQGVVPTERVSFARDQLTQQIARAATLGLLDTRPIREETQAQTSVVAAVSPVVQALPPNNNLHAERVVDRGILQPTKQAVQTASGQSCIGDQYFDLASWGSDTTFASQIGAARAALSGEFDRTPPDAAVNLARLYLFFGFGAEARQALRMAEVDLKTATVYGALAEILETGATRSSTLSGQIGCDAPVALWSAMSYEVLPPNMPAEMDAVLRALMALPTHLRRHIGPQLARKLVAGGRASAAERVLRIVDRIPEEPAAEQALARAEFSIAEGMPEGADADLEIVVDANAEGSAEALVKRIDTRLKTGRAVPPEMADLAGAYAHEYRDAPLGKALSRAYIEAMAASGDFDTAMAEATRLERDLSDAAKDTILATMLRLLTDNADDLTFLRIGTELSQTADRVSPETANAVAARMIALGFADLARPFVSPSTTGFPLQQRRLLRAEIAILASSPRAAQIELLGVEGDGADRLRARALSMLGEHLEAHAIYLSLGDMDAALREALLAEEWQQTVNIADPALADMVAASVATLSEDSAGVLARNKALLESSQSARETIDALLGARVLPTLE
ncbi:hypothetical protein KUD11_02690 [Roseovarius sp. LXJ103]|uniref:hypothetical protein n=1 Tax=Roseovarius carneus TaxID=2853164 RepID=UPI000D60A979|nr:hypothetical protein [Roseovarius carneus]MBZ8117547.1 hypothetical protein [Roseovarius carneus]PWE36659.1 hypothetical protein DD563_12250 [Pelagicola sp. LXJ1103]